MIRTSTAPDVRKAKRDWEKSNAEAARAILAEPWKYPPDSFSALWARCYHARMAKQKACRREKAA